MNEQHGLDYWVHFAGGRPVRIENGSVDIAMVGKGIKVYRVFSRDGSMSECHHYLKYKDAIIDIKTNRWGKDTATALEDPVFNRMLASFRFTESTKWLTYRNPEFSFAMEYPERMYLWEDDNRVLIVIEPALFEAISPHEEKYRPRYSVYFHKDTIDEDLESWVLREHGFTVEDIGKMTEEGGRMESIDRVIIGGDRQGFRVHEWPSTTSMGLCHIYVKQADVVVDISKLEAEMGPTDWEKDEVFQRMLSTVKFTAK